MTNEDLLITQCRYSLDDCLWSVGLWASEWMERHARGRDLSELAQMLCIRPAKLASLRNVADRFFDEQPTYPNLRWGHFHAVWELDEEVATSCLRWAEDNIATVAEMNAWRRAMGN